MWAVGIGHVLLNVIQKTQKEQRRPRIRVCSDMGLLGRIIGWKGHQMRQDILGVPMFVLWDIFRFKIKIGERPLIASDGICIVFGLAFGLICCSFRKGRQFETDHSFWFNLNTAFTASPGFDYLKGGWKALLGWGWGGGRGGQITWKLSFYPM